MYRHQETHTASRSHGRSTVGLESYPRPHDPNVILSALEISRFRRSPARQTYFAETSACPLLQPNLSRTGSNALHQTLTGKQPEGVLTDVSFQLITCGLTGTGQCRYIPRRTDCPR